MPKKTRSLVTARRYMKMKEGIGYLKPCDTCYWKKWPYARRDEVCGFHNKPNEDGTCKHFEHEFPEIEYEHPLKMNRIRGLR